MVKAPRHLYAEAKPLNIVTVLNVECKNTQWYCNATSCVGPVCQMRHLGIPLLSPLAPEESSCGNRSIHAGSNANLFGQPRHLQHRRPPGYRERSRPTPRRTIGMLIMNEPWVQKNGAGTPPRRWRGMLSPVGVSLGKGR